MEFKPAETGTGGDVPPLPWNDTALLNDLDTETRSPDLDSARGRVHFLMDKAPGPVIFMNSESGILITGGKAVQQIQ
ncbi:hypothetical protein F5B19DRAFT_492429 [Rostrohypoxylon terebratum]|nr:hypothetical protein F5B19DRAFT_492429 [Rostrohypoxylon terebratum]